MCTGVNELVGIASLQTSVSSSVKVAIIRHASFRPTHCGRRWASKLPVSSPGRSKNQESEQRWKLWRSAQKRRNIRKWWKLTMSNGRDQKPYKIFHISLLTTKCVCLLAGYYACQFPVKCLSIQDWWQHALFFYHKFFLHSYTSSATIMVPVQSPLSRICQLTSSCSSLPRPFLRWISTVVAAAVALTSFNYAYFKATERQRARHNQLVNLYIMYDKCIIWAWQEYKLCNITQISHIQWKCNISN